MTKCAASGRHREVRVPTDVPTVLIMKGGVAIAVKIGDWGRGYFLIMVRAVDRADGSLVE